MIDDKNYNDYVDKIVNIMSTKYGFRFTKKAVRKILNFALNNAHRHIKNSHEIYIRGRFSIYLTKDIMDDVKEKGRKNFNIKSPLRKP